MNGKPYLYLFIFLTMMACGIMVGRYIGQDSSDTALSPLAQKGISTPSSADQFSVLVVGVDDLTNNKARLESIWWLMIDIPNTQVILMPLYPAINPQHNDPFAKPHDPFTIKSLDLDRLGKLDMIEESNITWDFTALIDAYTLNSAIEIGGENWEKNQGSEQPSLLDNAPKTWNDPAASLQFQHGLLQFLCTHSEALTKPEAAEKMLSFFGTHIHTDIQSQQITLLWSVLNKQDTHFKCRFPWNEQ